ncbi:MAG TPA: hypothetical protein VNA17_09085 [Pyrinomonadaceae bacterium]|nr:hypothetical protein [Pyrinomonadaceae bacterium]
MFLSNRPENFLFLIICAVVFGACGWPDGNDAKAVPIAPKTPGEFPFSTIEPETYQGDVTVSDGQIEKRWFVARKRELSRLDFYSGGDLSHSKLAADKIYLVDHKRKVYIVTDETITPGASPEMRTGLPDAIYRGKQYREFEETGRENGRIHYKVTPDAFSKGEILISIDEATGIMIRQEFRDGPEPGGPAAFVYEMKDLRTDVEDAVFTLPPGYKKVGRKEFHLPLKQLIK